MFAKLTLYCACLALAAALVRREAPATTPLQDLEKHAAEFQKTFSTQLSSLANSKNTQEMTKALKEGTDSVLQQLSQLSSSLQGVLADVNGKAKQVLEQTRANIEKTTTELRKAHPEVEQEAVAVQERLKAAVQQGVQHTQQLARDLETSAGKASQELQPKIKAFYDDFIKQVEQVQKKLHEAATKQ